MFAGLPSDSDLNELENALKSCGADVTALQYVRTLKRNNLTGAAKGGQEGGMSGLGLASQSNLLDWADKTFGSGLSQVTKVAKTLLSGAEAQEWNTLTLASCELGN